MGAEVPQKGKGTIWPHTSPSLYNSLELGTGLMQEEWCLLRSSWASEGGCSQVPVCLCEAWSPSSLSLKGQTVRLSSCCRGPRSAGPFPTRCRQMGQHCEGLDRGQGAEVLRFLSLLCLQDPQTFGSGRRLYFPLQMKQVAGGAGMGLFTRILE